MKVRGPIQSEPDINVDLSKRQFLKVAGVASIGVLVVSTTACPGGAKVTIYMQTISGLLNEIALLMPAKSEFIRKTLKIAADFDAAYRRGDLANADAFFNTLTSNLTTLTVDLGVNLSDQMKMWLAVIGATVRTVAVLLRDQVGNTSTAKSIAKSAKSAAAVERLANASAVDAAFQAARLQ